MGAKGRIGKGKGGGREGRGEEGRGAEEMGRKSQSNGPPLFGSSLRSVTDKQFAIRT